MWSESSTSPSEQSPSSTVHPWWVAHAEQACHWAWRRGWRYRGSCWGHFLGTSFSSSPTDLPCKHLGLWFHFHVGFPDLTPELPPAVSPHHFNDNQMATRGHRRKWITELEGTVVESFTPQMKKSRPRGCLEIHLKLHKHSAS